MEPTKTIVQFLQNNGYVHEPKSIEKELKRANYSHENSMELTLHHMRNDIPSMWYTGFALSNDGIWRRHSWVWSVDTETLYETTCVRDLYFGCSVFDFSTESVSDK